MKRTSLRIIVALLTFFLVSAGASADAAGRWRPPNSVGKSFHTVWVAPSSPHSFYVYSGFNCKGTRGVVRPGHQFYGMGSFRPVKGKTKMYYIDNKYRKSPQKDSHWDYDEYDYNYCWTFQYFPTVHTVYVKTW